MSKIYKRPMFRGGGKVSSYGNGIATGLADGGRVNLKLGGPPLFDPAVTGSFKSPPTNRQVNRSLFGGFSNAPQIKTGTSIVENALNNAKTNTSKIKTGIGNIKSGIGKMEFNERGLLKGLKKIPGYLDKGVGALRTLGRANPYLTTAAATGYVTRDLPIDELIYEQEGYGPIEGKFRKLVDPTYNSKMMDIYKQGYDKDGKLNALLKEQTEKKEDADAADTFKPTVIDPITAEPIVESRKDRLKRTAKEYQEILGEGIKKDSIFDAMVTGGTSLLAGEGYASAIRQANKELDPIQNIKTAANKAALEEDIALKKAIALDKTKRTATSDIIALGKSSGKSDAEIYKDVIKNKSKSKAEIISGYKEAFGTSAGFKEYVKDTYKGSNIKFFDVDIEKVDFETVENGVYYQPPTGKADKYKDKFVTVKDNKVIKVTPRNR
jgi:hypothetical protein